MANEVSLTQAQIRPLNARQTVIRNFDAGAEVYVGYAVYEDSSGDVQHADADALTTARANGIVVATYDGEVTTASGNRVAVAVFGPVSGFSSMTPGGLVYVSGTVGRITQTKPATGYAHVIGYALDANTVWVDPNMESPESL
jgi:hypothetical protein